MDIRLYKDSNGVKIFEHIDKCNIFITSLSNKKLAELENFWNSTKSYGTDDFNDFIISYALLRGIRKEWNRIGQPKIKFKSC